MQIPWQAGTDSLRQCAGRCLCLLNTFLLPSSFCNNNDNKKKLIKKKNPTPSNYLLLKIGRVAGELMPPDPWKQVARCTRSPQELARTPGVLQPCCPGKTLGMWLSAAETKSSKKPRRGWLTHGF